MNKQEEIDSLKKEIQKIDKAREKASDRATDWNHVCSEMRERKQKIENQIDDIANENHFVSKLKKSWTITSLEKHLSEYPEILKRFQNMEVVSNKDAKFFLEKTAALRLDIFRIYNDVK